MSRHHLAAKMEIILDINQFIEEVNAVDWRQYDDPAYFQYRYDGINSFAQTTPQVLISLALVEKKEDMYREVPTTGGGTALSPKYFDVLDAVGHNSRGCYYPVIRNALPFIIKIALSGNSGAARHCAIDCLIELYYFYPERGLDELQVFVRTSIEESIDDLIKVLKADNRDEESLNSLLEISAGLVEGDKK